MNRTTARNCSDGLSAGFGFYDDGGTGTSAPDRYFGDTAVTSVNAETRLVTCWEQGPLVIPPCYDLLETAHFPDCPSIDEPEAKKRYAGMCPHNLYFTVPALGGFDTHTGETICARDFGLILGDRTSNTPYHCTSDDGDAFQGIKYDHHAECSGTGRFGVIGGDCAHGYAGWLKTGGNPDCLTRRGRGLKGPPGKQGLPDVIPALPGPPGLPITCDCYAPSP